MIHVVPISEMPAFVVDQVCRRLFTTFGVGAEAAAGRRQQPGGGLDVAAFLAAEPKASAFVDDQTLFLTDASLTLPAGPLGAAPAGGYADGDRGAAIVTTDGIPLPPSRSGDEDESAWLAYAGRVARRAVHQIGFLWGLHRCVDVRCAMSPPWLGDAPPELCDFCRERTEAHGRRARS